MPSKGDEADFANAYKDLTEAEKTAATLEAQLNALEQKLDDFLAEHDKPGEEAIDKNDTTQHNLSKGDEDSTKKTKDS